MYCIALRGRWNWLIFPASTRVPSGLSGFFPHSTLIGSLGGKHITPQRHENSEEDSDSVVKQVWGSGQWAHGAEKPVVTHSVTQGTHGDVQVVVTRLLTEIKEDENNMIYMYNDNNMCFWWQCMCLPTSVCWRPQWKCRTGRQWCPGQRGGWGAEYKHPARQSTSQSALQSISC